MKNAINWFEIPAKDFGRAKKFYAEILGRPLQESPNPSFQYAFLPYDPTSGGVGGAIVCSPDYEPSMLGSVIYLNGGEDLSSALARVEEAGGRILLPKSYLGEGMGHMALFMDTEGNKVGFYSMK